MNTLFIYLFIYFNTVENNDIPKEMKKKRHIFKRRELRYVLLFSNTNMNPRLNYMKKKIYTYIYITKILLCIFSKNEF